MNSLLRTDKELTELYHRHADTVWRVCYSFLKSKTDSEDMVQETFLRLLACGKQFQSAEHKAAVYLYYYEGYSAREIAARMADLTGP